MRQPILIAGPTVSGKSSLAATLAERLDGVVINADSQQVYRDWRVLTARPSAEDEARVPHRLYGHIPLDEDYSAGHWLRDIDAELKRCDREGRVPVVVGGTGLYFKSLTEGLAAIPDVPPEVRTRGEAEWARIGQEAFAAEFERRDPETAARIDLNNPRRLLRAWEVLEATGTGLAEWQARTPPPFLPLSECMAIALTPDRDQLYARCGQRFDQMIADGALQEARAVLDLNPPAGAPGLKAVGAAELFAHLRDETTLEDAAERAKMETRRYAKRQLTWIRNQMPSWRRLDPDDLPAIDDILSM